MVEPVCLPADFVALTVGKGASEHREADDVGVAGGMGERPLAIDPHEQGYVILAGSEGTDVLEAVVLTVMGHGLAIEKAAEDLDGLGEPGLADRRGDRRAARWPRTR